MEAEKPKRSSVFISYSHEDVVWLERLRVHLTPLVRENKIEIWDDTKITPGVTCQVIDDKTGGQLRDAKVNVETKEGTQVHPLDSEAKFYLNLPSSTKTVRVKIAASGHKDFDEPVTLEAGTNYVRIKRKPVQNEPPDGLSAGDRRRQRELDNEP